MSFSMQKDSIAWRHPAGTRFRLFAQYDEGLPAEVITVSSPPGSLDHGPADRRMYVANAVDKRQPYAPPDLAPPYDGPVHAPAVPDRNGHFDGIAEHLPQFRAAHMFGTVRLVLDLWEAAFGERIHWWHPDAPARLELIPAVAWQNAQSGPGFLETGFWPGADGAPQPFSLNFDVIAHEVGHAILFSRMGVPPGRIPAQFLGFHEAFGDLVALLGALHFSSVRRRLLEQTGGNLYALNLVNRLAETAPNQQIRLASNAATMADMAGLEPLPDGDWLDPAGLGRNAHDLSLPLLGAVFDVLVELYQNELAARGLVRPAADPRDWSPRAVAQSLSRVGAEHARSLARFAQEFEAALLVARDAVLRGLVHVLRTLDAAETGFDVVAARMLESLHMQGAPPAQFGRLLGLFQARGIEPAPFLAAAPLAAPHSVRASRRRAVLVPAQALHVYPGHDPAALRAARRLMPHHHRSAAP